MTMVTELLASVTRRGRRWIGWRGAEQADATPVAILDQARALLTHRGEASGLVMARALIDAYQRLDANGRVAVLRGLANDFGPDRKLLDPAVAAYQAAPDETRASALHIASEPRRQEIIRRLNRAPGGTLALVRLREDLLKALPHDPTLSALDADLIHLFSSWFNRGFLVVKRIDWSSPANVLEKIIRYEAVHTIRDWDDLRRRLQPDDRRCYAFFHPQLADEPLIFVEVALTTAVPDAIAPLIDEHATPIDAEDARVAVFYSISNCQDGLSGISFGSFLIKQVVAELQRDLPKLTTFVTLSPVPGFAAWLARARAGSDPVIGPEDRDTLRGLDDPSWRRDFVGALAIDKVLGRLCAHYLVKAKSAKGRPLDPVARFHIGNGARLDRVNVGADLSTAGLTRSHGVMVNYLYDLDRIEVNHEAYAERGEVAASAAVVKLAEGRS